MRQRKPPSPPEPSLTFMTRIGRATRENAMKLKKRVPAYEDKPLWKIYDLGVKALLRQEGVQ